MRASRREPKTEALAEHTSPFCVRTEREHFRIRVHFDEENLRNYIQKPSTGAEYVSTVEPSIALQSTTASPKESNSLYSLSKTQTPNTGLQGKGPCSPGEGASRWKGREGFEGGEGASRLKGGGGAKGGRGRRSKVGLRSARSLPAPPSKAPPPFEALSPFRSPLLFLKPRPSFEAVFQAPGPEMCTFGVLV